MSLVQGKVVQKAIQAEAWQRDQSRFHTSLRTNKYTVWFILINVLSLDKTKVKKEEEKKVSITYKLFLGFEASTLLEND